MSIYFKYSRVHMPHGFEGPIVVLEKTLESPLDSKSVLKQINPEYSHTGKTFLPCGSLSGEELSPK